MVEPERAGSTSAPVKPPRRRWGRRIAWLGLGLLVLAVLVVFVLPTPVARWIVAGQLDRLGITHDGLETVVVDLWNNRVHVGPVALGAGDAEPARIGTVDVTYSLTNLFERRALVETFSIAGVDVHARRRDDGLVEVNGILPPAFEDDAPPPADDDAETGSSFGFGIQTLEFVDSRLVFEDTTGGTLTLDLERLRLEDFLSWTPEDPERLSLEATLNDLRLSFTGTSTLFAQPIEIKLNGHVEDGTLDKIVRFTGPTGLVRQDGTFSIQGEHAYTLREDGSIEGTSTGTIVIDGVDVVTPEDDAATVDRIEVHYDVKPSVAADDTIQLGGGLDVALTALDLETAAGETLRLASGSLALEDLALTRQAGEAGALHVVSAASAGAPSLFEALVQAVIALGREALRADVEGAATPSLTVQGLEVRAAEQTLRVDDASFAAPGLRANGANERWSVATPLSSTASGIVLAGDVGTRIDSLELTSAELQARTDLTNATIDFDLDLALDAVAAALPDGTAIDLARLGVRTEGFEVAGWAGRGTATGDLTVEASGLRGSREGGAAPATVAADTVRVALPNVEAESRDGLALRASGRVDGRELGVGVSGASPANVELASLGLDIGEVRASTSGQALTGNATLEGLSVTAGGEPAQTIGVSTTTLEGIDADPSAAVGVERITLSGLDANLEIAALAGTGAAPSAGGDVATGTGEALPVRIGRLVVESGSTVQIVDRSAGEALQLRFALDGIDVGPIDTGDVTVPTEFAVTASVEETATIEADGEATPLASPPGGNVDARIAGFPLPLISPYVARLVGATIESGELDLDVNAQATAGALAGTVGLRVADLFLGEPSEALEQGFEADFGVPLNFAVGILKDDNGVIQFDLPLSGTVEAPTVDYSEVVSQAIGGAMASLLPTNWFGNGGAVSIEPAFFIPGTAELTEEGAAVADRVAEVLGQKSTLRVRVCGKGAAADLAALRGLDPAAGVPSGAPTDTEVSQVLELALERAQAVRAYLVDRHQIAAERIGECRTSYSFETDAPPRAEFQL